MILLNLLQYAFAFLVVWFGSGLIVSSTSKFSQKLRLSSFAFSFVFLGILTSTPEFSVGLQAVAKNDPEIFIGNLLGGIIVLFLVIIPLLAIFGNGISLKNDLDHKALLVTLGVIATPSILLLDKRLSMIEGIILILSYIGMLFLVERKNGIFDRSNSQLLNIKAYSYKDLIKIIVGIGLVFVSSKIIVEQTLFFAGVLNISAFYISLLVVALGTDMPEISLAIRSVISGKKDIAMGDYIGAAAASTLLFGIFTLLSGGEVISESGFYIATLFIGVAVGLFYFFSRTRNYVSRGSGIIMFAVYILFVILEVTR